MRPRPGSRRRGRTVPGDYTTVLQVEWQRLRRRALRSVVAAGALLGFVAGALMYPSGPTLRAVAVGALLAALRLAGAYHLLTLRETHSRDVWRLQQETAELQAENLRLWSEKRQQ